MMNSALGVHCVFYLVVCVICVVFVLIAVYTVSRVYCDELCGVWCGIVQRAVLSFILCFVLCLLSALECGVLFCTDCTVFRGRQQRRKPWRKTTTT